MCVCVCVCVCGVCVCVCVCWLHKQTGIWLDLYDSLRVIREKNKQTIITQSENSDKLLVCMTVLLVFFSESQVILTDLPQLIIFFQVLVLLKETKKYNMNRCDIMTLSEWEMD